MAKPGLILMALIAMAVMTASCRGQRELFTPEQPASASAT